MLFKIKYSKFLSLIFLFITIHLDGQQPDSNNYRYNIVPNYSFEDHGTIPCDRILVGRYDLFNVDSWAWASFASADIFSTKNDAKCWSHASNLKDATSNYGTIKPRTGKIMLGFYTTGDIKYHEYHEYLITRLNEPMIPGYDYYVEFWICRCASTELASNNIGALFTKNPVFNPDIKSIYTTPDINCDKVVHDFEQWVKVSGHYSPSDTMFYMMIGNFFPDNKTKLQYADAHFKNFYFMRDTYYYIDDVYVIPPKDAPKYSNKNKSEFEKLNVNEPFILKNIYFGFDKTELLPKSFVQLNKLVNFLKNYPSVTVEISGHTDNKGTREYNVKLSKARADAVSAYLIENGIMESRIKTKGYAEIKPIAPNQNPDGSDNPTGRKLNRRVEFKILKK